MKTGLIFIAVLIGALVSAFEAPPRQAGKISPAVYKLPSEQEMDSGTIRFSFQWTEPDARSFITMLQLDGTDNMLRLYIYPHHRIGFLVLRRMKGENLNSTLFAHRYLIDQWRKTPEKWHRIVLTWNSTEGRLYLDGRLMANDTRFGREPVRFSQVIWGGATIHYAPGKPDELTRRCYELGKLEILPEVMTPEAVIADWRSVNPGYRDIDEF